MLWLKLTAHDGTEVRVNMALIVDYTEHEEEGGKTFLSSGVDDKGLPTGYHIQETKNEIDDALTNVANPLRLIRGGW